MEREARQLLPTWAPRVSRSLLRRFYEGSALGIIDEPVIDELGIALYARCESMIEVKEAKRGRVKCPDCHAVIDRSGSSQDSTRVVCDQCSWECDWVAYRNHYKGTLLNPGQIESDIREYVRCYKAARDYSHKIVLIDTLIHLIHDEVGGGSKPGAYAFIEGQIEDVAAFLDGLAYGQQVPDEVRRRRDEWRARVAKARGFWSGQLRPQDAPRDGEAQGAVCDKS